MHDYLDLGPTPSAENCEQVPYADPSKARRECERFIKLLEALFPFAPELSWFQVRSNPHDFGSYYSVVVHFDDSYADTLDYAFFIESHLPEEWTITARMQYDLLAAFMQEYGIEGPLPPPPPQGAKIEYLDWGRQSATA